MKLFIQLGFLSATNILIAFLYQWYVLICLGPGHETDALFAGMTIPQLMLAVVSGSLMNVLVPLLSGEIEERFQHDAWAFLALVGGFFSLFAIGLFLLAPFWVPLTVPGFDEKTCALTVNLTRIQLIGMVFTALNGVQWAVYRARQKFLWAELAPILASIFPFLLFIWALPRFGVIAAAWISVLRMGLQTLLLAPGMGRPVRPDLNSVAIREAWQRIKPLMLGTAYYKTDPMVDRFLLSSASSGNLSLYYLAQQIYGAISQVLNKAIAVPLVPALSMLHKEGDKLGFRHIYLQKLLQVGSISLIVLVVLGLFGRALLSLLVGHGSVSSDNVEELWWIMLWLGGMFIGGTMGQITSSTFYSVGDTRTITRMSMFSYTAYIPCKVAAFYLWGILGLALITTIYFMTNLSIQIYILRKKWAA